MLRIAIVDDEPDQIANIRRLIEGYAEKRDIKQQILISEYASGNDLLRASARLFDMIFLDFQMPGLNGYETAVRIRETDKQVVLVFITNFLEYWQAGYKVRAYHYLLKPINERSFAREMEGAFNELIGRGDMISFDAINVGPVQFKKGNILYIESSKHDSAIHLLEKQGDRDIVRIHGGISDISKRMKQYKFVRPFVSYCVNIDYIAEAHINEDYLILIDGTKLYISRTYKKDVVEALAELMEGLTCLM